MQSPETLWLQEIVIMVLTLHRGVAGGRFPVINRKQGGNHEAESSA